METSGLLPTPQARDWKGAVGKNRHSPSVADALISLQQAHPVKPLPRQASGEARRMTVGSGRKLLKLYESSSRHGVFLRTCTASLLLSKVWFSRNCALRWKASATTSNRLLFRLLPSTLHTDGTEYGLLRTPTVREPGTATERLVTKDGQPFRLGQSAYDRLTGHHARIGLSQQLGHATGAQLRLSVAFVSWMMGLPENWLSFPTVQPSARRDSEKRG